MERMSDKLKDVCSEFYLSAEERCSVTAAIDRLAHYEDLEEQGRLVVLPNYKIGDIVFKVAMVTENKSGGKHCRVINGVGNLHDAVCGRPRGGRYRNKVISLEVVERPLTKSDMSRIGATVFLTREEAATALAQANEAQRGGGA